MFSISIRIKESLDNIVVKDIKSILLFRPRLLKLIIKDYLKDRKAYLNITTTFSIYTPIIRTKGIRLYIVGLIIYL